MTPESPNRVERILAAMMLATVGLSIVSFLAIIFGTLSGMGSADFAVGAWPAVAVLPYFGLPLAMILLVLMLVLNMRRRARDAAAARKGR